MILVRPGERSPRVALIQILLNRAGNRLRVDGMFGPKTRAAVTHAASDVAEMRREFRGDIRRLDDRIFKLMLLTLATLATAIATLVANLVT